MDEKNERNEGYWMDGWIDWSINEKEKRWMERKMMNGVDGRMKRMDGWKEESKKRKMNGWRKGERKISDQRKKERKKNWYSFLHEMSIPSLMLTGLVSVWGWTGWWIQFGLKFRCNSIKNQNLVRVTACKWDAGAQLYVQIYYQLSEIP